MASGRPDRGRFCSTAGAALLCLLLLPTVAWARLDLSAASVERLENGLTLIVLEEPAFPVVSVQVAYRVGARNEPAGGSGLAHFLEHMAFRSSENFPDTGLVSSIYAIGGEWHGYTWLDQTTYYATAPREGLDLLLRIEADRMARLDLPRHSVEAERGAVLSELHGYENEPDAVLQDHVMYLSFLAHPYRNNTIGWKSDVEGLSHAEIVDFYRRHYHPGNAVLAVVGDVDADAVLRRVRDLFGGFAGREPTPRPRTVEPGQQGERRIELRAPVQQPRFRMAWRAPSVHDADFAVFLVSQELLAGGSGVSFLQNDWGTPARPESPLGRIGADLSTWYPPSDQRYAFVVSGTLPDGQNATGLESAVAEVIEGVASDLERRPEAWREAVAAARIGVRRALLFDIQTTEDAAHQLACFSGMDALDVLVGLPAAVEQVSVAEVAAAIRRWLGREQRTVAWALPEGYVEPAADNTRTAAPVPEPRQAAAIDPLPAQRSPPVAPPPALHRLSSGLPVILQPSPLSATAQVQVLLPGAQAVPSSQAEPNAPAWGVTSLQIPLLSGSLATAIDSLPERLQAAEPYRPAHTTADDPESRVAHHLQDLLGLPESPGPQQGPLLVVIAGDFDPADALRRLETNLGELPPAPRPEPGPLNPIRMTRVESTLPFPYAQERLAYVTRAPGPREPEAAAAWLALYVLAHDYEGRLGKEAISRRGLVYYIDAAYHSNGRDGWITLEMGVDPVNRAAMQTLLRAELERLVTDPPSEGELEEARRHLLGRFVSADQSNPELASRLARDWLWFGGVPDETELRRRLEAVTRQDVIELLTTLVSGTEITVRNPGQP